MSTMMNDTTHTSDTSNTSPQHSSNKNNNTPEEPQQASTAASTSISLDNLFQSTEFQKFVGSLDSKTLADVNSWNSAFLSKELSLSGLTLPTTSRSVSGGGSIFNSREAFSALLNSGTFDMKPSSLPSPSTISSSSLDAQEKALTETRPRSGSKSSSLPDGALTSREWVPFGNLGSHVDVSYDANMFGTEPPAAAPKSKKKSSDWNNLFFSQLQVPQPPLPPSDKPKKKVTTKQEDVAEPTVSEEPQTDHTAKRKRKRKTRPKVVPKVFEYVEPIDNDVLLGRGGRSNHHPGNIRYRQEVLNLKEWYKNIDDKDEKTDLSQCLVDYVHSYGGRFLEKHAETKSWYVVPNIVARRKASQALREDNDPEKRAAKRARFLAKKKRQEEATKATKTTTTTTKVAV